MLYGTEVAVCSKINTKHTNTVWTEQDEAHIFKDPVRTAL
jgi:hypothetical protein